MKHVLVPIFRTPICSAVSKDISRHFKLELSCMLANAKIKVSQINLSYDCRAVKWGFVRFHLALVLSGKVSSELCASLTTKSYKLFTLWFLKLVLLEHKGKFAVTGRKLRWIIIVIIFWICQLWIAKICERWYTLVVRYLYTFKAVESGGV